MTAMARYTPIPIDTYIQGAGHGSVAFVEMAPPIPAAPIAPAFIFGAMGVEDSTGMFTTNGTGPAGYYTVRGAVLTHDGICLHETALLTSLITNFPTAHCVEMVRHVTADISARPPRRIEGRCVLMTGPGFTTWGHWLVDFLPRLYLMELAGWDIKKLQWIIPTRTPAFARELLSLLGLPSDCLVEYDPAVEMVQVNELIIPTNLAAGPLVHPIFNEVIAWLKRRLHFTMINSAAKCKKVFLSRSSVAFQRMLNNRDVIETIARAADYTVIDPARLSVPDQLGLFYTATQIVGEYGSGLHSSIFSPVSSLVTCLRGPNHTAGALQNGLAKAAGQRIGYIFGDRLEDSPVEAFTISPLLFQQGLAYGEFIT